MFFARSLIAGSALRVDAEALRAAAPPRAPPRSNHVSRLPPSREEQCCAQHSSTVRMPHLGVPPLAKPPRSAVRLLSVPRSTTEEIAFRRPLPGPARARTEEARATHGRSNCHPPPSRPPRPGSAPMCATNRHGRGRRLRPRWSTSSSSCFSIPARSRAAPSTICSPARARRSPPPPAAITAPPSCLCGGLPGYCACIFVLTVRV